MPDNYTLWSEKSIENIQELEVEIIDWASSLSKRGKDAFLALYHQCNANVATMAHTLMAPDFSWTSYHQGIGGKTLDELTTFTKDILGLVGRHKGASGLDDWELVEEKCRLLRCGITEEDAEKLQQSERRLGYFPVVAFVQAWLSSRNERDRHIYRHGLAIWEDAQEEPLASMAEDFDITAERCRQIRNRLFEELSDYLHTIETEGPCPYDCLGKDLASKVNQAEGTAFTADFIRFILGSTYPHLTVVGGHQDSFFVKLKGGTEDTFVAAIPRALSETFDFNSFLTAAQTRNTEKRTKTQYLQLPEWDLEAKELACALAGLRYGWTSENGSLVIPPNADKNRSDIMEDIIRDAGHPLTIDEIAGEYARRYPNRSTDKTKIRANMQGNPKIVPIGRSGIYSLSEWDSGQTRGGTIRSFVRECLNNSGTHIVPSKEVYEYVRRFRPNSSDENIITNLMLETDKPFRIIWKDDVSFLSYSADPLPDGYKQITRTFTEKRSFEESIALLDDFISHFGYMPKVCDDPEQTRLARFLSNIRSLRRHGLLPQEEMEELQRIENKVNGGCIQLELF